MLQIDLFLKYIIHQNLPNLGYSASVILIINLLPFEVLEVHVDLPGLILFLYDLIFVQELLMFIFSIIYN